jgi:hypothetical protein
MSGWELEIVAPFEALIAPRKLVWKEKYGTLRAEWLRWPDGTVEMVGDYGRVLEESSRLCCADCGRWNGWISDSHGAAEVTTAPVHGWVMTLCTQCRTKAEGAKP